MINNGTQSNFKEELLYRILDSLDACIYVSDPDTYEILYINEKMSDIFGGKDLTGKICWKVLQDGMDAPCDFCPNKQLVANPNSTVVWEEHNTLTKQYYKNTDRIIEWSDGRLVHIQHSVDITDIKKAEQTMARQFKQQELLTKVSMNFASSTDFENIISDSLEAIGVFYGLDRIYILKNTHQIHMTCAYSYVKPGSSGLSVKDTVQKSDLGDDYNKLANMEASSAKNLVGEVKSYIKNPIVVHGKMWGIMCFECLNSDITWDQHDLINTKVLSNIFSSGIERHHIELEMIKRDKQLELSVQEAERANSAKSDFLSRMSHEIRTPMNAIIGMTHIAKSSNSIDKMNNCLDKIDSSSKHLLGIINDILDMSKIEANKMEISSIEFNLEKMLVDLCNVITVKADEKGQTLQIELGTGVSSLYKGDPLRLSQVLTNLLSNAIKFSDENTLIRVTISLVKSVNGVSTLKFEISDKGIGMTKEQITKLFSPFEQADGGIARRFGGTGLGLSICKRMVELMGGDIHVESEAGKGSTFIFTVKLGDVARKERSTLSPKIDLDKLRVMVIDDSLEVREYFSALMQENNINTSTAESAAEAITMMEEADRIGRPFNLVFVDWRMPEMDGIQAARAIKEKFYAQPIVILISVAEWSSVEKQAIEAGIVKFLSKPLFPSSIVDTINEVLGVAPAKSRSGIDRSPKMDYSDKHILLVEDIEINQEIFLALVESTKIKVSLADNGLVAVEEFLKNSDYDMILMDVHMPVLDGYSATKKIRSIDSKKAREIPIIAMTANVFKEDIDKCIKAGMNDHIAKPIDESILMSKLLQYLRPEINENRKEETAMSNEFTIMEDFLPYIDIKDGVGRIMNNKKLYAKLVKSFSANTLMDDINNDMKEHNLEQAQYHVHTLKGTAANLSFPSLFETSFALEKAIKDGGDTASLLAELESSYKKTMGLLDSVIVFIEE